MARPTDEKKEKTVKLRISGDLYEKLSLKGDNMSATIRQILKDSFVPHKNTENSTKIEASPKEMEEISSIARFFDISGEELLKIILNGLVEGNLTIEDGKLVVVNE